MSWSLWSSDFFDRESAPFCDARGEALEEGLAQLWAKTLDEGVLDDGRPTFTWFTLRHDGGAVTLPRDPLKNPALAKLRAWRGEPALLARLVALHLAAPDETTATALLAKVDAVRDARSLLASL